MGEIQNLMRIFWKKGIFGSEDDSFDFYYKVYRPLAKRFSWLQWLDEECPISHHGYSWYHMLTTPTDLWSETRDQIVYAYQRVTKGYDKPSTYNTSSHLSQQIPEILKELKAWGNGYPCGIIGHGSVAIDADDPGLVKWHGILDEMIAGFEAAQKIIGHDSPVYREFEEEWSKRYPGVPSFYFEESDDPDDDSVEMKCPPEYDALREELRVREREKEWMNEQLKLFHRGMLLFHEYYFDLWD